MRVLAVMATAVVLSGCVFNQGQTGPTALPKDAYGAIWTAKPTDAVSACLNQAGLSPVYQARPVNPKKSVYTTMIVVTAPDARSHTDPRAYDCALERPVAG